MVLVAKGDNRNLAYRACFVWRAVDVEDWDGPGEGAGGDAIRADVLGVQEEAGCSRVYQGLGAATNICVGGLDFNIDLQRVRTV